MTKIRYDVNGRRQQPRYITVYMHQFLSQHGHLLTKVRFFTGLTKWLQLSIAYTLKFL